MWETRNTEVHGDTQNEQTTKLLHRQKTTIEKLMSLKDKCLARDHYIFPQNATNLLNETSTSKLATWIATRKHVIKHSIKHAMKQDVQHTNPITTWFTPTSASQLAPELQWHRNRLLHDPYNKKKKHKQPETTEPSLKQTQLTNFFT